MHRKNKERTNRRKQYQEYREKIQKQEERKKIYIILISLIYYLFLEYVGFPIQYQYNDLKIRKFFEFLNILGISESVFEQYIFIIIFLFFYMILKFIFKLLLKYKYIQYDQYNNNYTWNRR